MDGEYMGIPGPMEVSPIALAVLVNDADLVTSLSKGDITLAIQIQKSPSVILKTSAL